MFNVDKSLIYRCQLKLQTQINIPMMLKQKNRYNQKFLVKYQHSNSSILNCCHFLQSFQDKAGNVQQKLNTQQKTSLKKLREERKQQVVQYKKEEIKDKGIRNSKKHDVQTHHFQKYQQIHQQKILRTKKQQDEDYRPYLISSCRSLQNLHAFNDLRPNNIIYKPLMFRYSQSHNQTSDKQPLTLQNSAHIQLTSLRQIQKIDQTTCLQLQSQESFNQNFGRSLTSTKLIISSEQKITPLQTEAFVQGQEQWSDESLSSQTKKRFEQIDEEESISDSISMHHKNKVTINHGSHPQVFEDFRKAHTINSNLSNDEDNFSGHSIVLDRDHYFFTPSKRYDKIQNHHLAYVDI